MKYLVTGGAGYLGSHLVRRLLDAGHHVRVLDKLLFGRASLNGLETNERFQLHVGDTSNVADVESALNDIDGVVALAAIVGDPACQINGDLSVRTNYWSTKLLAEMAQAKGVDKFIFASTCSVYGFNDTNLSTEDGWTNPLSLYAETKLNSESALSELDGDMKPIVLRLATLCGPSPRMRFDLVVNIMSATAFFENEVRVYGGPQYRPLLDVRDAARAFHLFLEKNNDEIEHQLYNIGSNSHNVTISDLGQIIAENAGNVPIIENPDVVDNRSYKVDFARFSKIMPDDFHSLKDSSQGVLDMFESKIVTDYKENHYYNSKYDY